MSLTWAGALAWRMQRHLLDPVGTGSVEAVVGRLGAVPARPALTPELAIGSRRERHRFGDVEQAVVEGRLIKTFAFRGATYIMRPDEASMYLALRAANRTWERPGWRTHYALQPSDWPALREAVREALTERPLTVAELGTAVSAVPRFRHLAPAFTDRSATFLKPFAWQGDMSFGPPRNGHATMQRLDHNPHWTGLRKLDEAGRAAVEAYLHSYGPATKEHLSYWLGAALGAPRQRLRTWIEDLAGRLATVKIDGQRPYVLADDLPDLTLAPASTTVRLLPAYDPWVVAAGTHDTNLVAPSRRSAVSRGANLVIAGGAVSGTWTIIDQTVTVAWFAERGTPPSTSLTDAVARLAATFERPLETVTATARTPR